MILVDSKEKPLDLMGRVVLENALQTPLTPLQKAGWVKRLKEAGKSAKEIASLFGVTEQSIRDWDVLANANPNTRTGKVRYYIDGRRVTREALDAARFGRRVDTFASTRRGETVRHHVCVTG